MNGSETALRRLLPAMLFVSGACGLVYEVLWSRYLSLFLGSTTLAHTYVLAVFLGGLSLGSWLFGRVADRDLDRLKLYGWLELGLALWCAAFPQLHRLLTEAYFSLVTLDTPPLASALLQAAFSVAALLPPSLLMGGTLPVLSRVFVRDESEVESGVSRLYAANTLGAVFGSLLAGLAMIRWIGLDASMLFAASWNALLGLSALGLSHARNADPALPITEEKGAVAGGGPVGAPEARSAVLLAVFVSGFCALVYELAWTRFFALVLGSSAYAFSLMLGAFLTGLTLGGWSAGRGRGRSPGEDLRLFALAQGGVALSMLVQLPFYDRLPWEFGRLMGLLQAVEAPFWAYQALCFSVCFALMLVPTFFSGLCLPIASRLAVSGMRGLGRSIGGVFALNTLGTILGAAATGLLLLPLLGVQGTFLLGVGLSAANGVLLWARTEPAPLTRRLAAAGAAAAAFALAAALAGGWDALALNVGAFRKAARGNIPDFRTLKQHFASFKVLYHKDGGNGTVLVHERKGGLHLVINGKADASTGSDMRTQILLAQVPLLLAPEPRAGPLRVLVIGLGSGITAGSALSHEGVEVDVVEISPEVAEAAVLFSAFNRRALEDPRLKLHVADAKTFLRLTRRKYHVIISEPSNPWVAGMGGLFTQEHFEAARDALEPGGLMVQWFHLYETDDAVVRLILRTFTSVFPHASVWNLHRTDVMLIGGAEPPRDDFSAMEARMRAPAVAEDMARIGLTQPAALLAAEVIEGRPLAELADRGPVNSDFFPDLEFDAPKAFYRAAVSSFFSLYDAHRWGRPGDGRTMLDRFLKGRSLTLEELESMSGYYGDPRDATGSLNVNFLPSVLKEAMARSAEGERFARLPLARRQAGSGNRTGALETLKRVPLEARPKPDELFAYADILHDLLRAEVALWHRPDPAPILKALARCAELDPEKADLYLHHQAMVHMDWGELAAAARDWEQALARQAANGKENVPRGLLEESMHDARARSGGS